MIQFENCVKTFSKIWLDEAKDAKITCWIAGGCVRDYFSAQPLKTDIDLFFPDIDNYDKCRKYMEENSCVILYDGANGCKVKYKKHTFDLVKKFFESPQHTIDSFDFTVSMFAVNSEKVFYGETSFIDLAKKQLMINKLPYPISTMSRAFRYYQKGFFICKGQQEKLAKAIQAVPVFVEVESAQGTTAPEPEKDNTEETSLAFGTGVFLGYD